MTITLRDTDFKVSDLASVEIMTKGNNIVPLSTEMNVDKVSRPSRMWQGHEEVDVITPCKEKLQKLFSCCQDVAQIVETLEAHMQLDRPKETPAMLEVDGTKIELILLRDELRRSKLYNKEIEVAKMSLERKLAEMEEKVQALTAQLMVYKEDFDLERRDRENAQGKLIDIEQQLLMYQRSYGSYQPRSTLEPCVPHFEQSPNSCYQQHYYLTTELIARGRDVCDYQTDGVVEDDRKIEERPALACTVKITEDAAKQDMDPDCCVSVQLEAQSFNIQDFFPVTVNKNKGSSAVSATPHDVCHKVLVEDGGNVTERGTLCTYGMKVPLPHTSVLDGRKLHAFADPFKTDLSHDNYRRQSVASPLGKQLVHQDKLLQDSSPTISWSFLSKDETAASLGNLNLYETDSPHLLSEEVLENSSLKCPKCRRPFLRSDHLLLLDHLEEC